MATKNKADTKVARAFPHLDVEKAEVYTAGDKILVTETFIVQFYGVQKRTVANWRKDGLRVHDMTITTLNLYDLKELIKWHSENVTGKSSFIETTSLNKEANLPDDECSADELDRRKKLQDVKKGKMLNAELEKSLIPAEDTDRAMAEQAVLHISQYSDDLDQLPSALENQSKEDIHNFLENHFERRIKNANNFIRKTFEIPNHLYTKIMEIIDET